MALYDHKCSNLKCNYEWEQEYSIKVDPPTQCPKCHQETAQRQISLGGKGIVMLEGQELVDKCKADAQQIQRDASRNENKFANLLGEDKHQALQQRIDRQKRDR